MNGENYIRFDWAMKRLLRNKANYVVLEVSCLHYLERNLRFTAFWRAKVTKKTKTINITE